MARASTPVQELRTLAGMSQRGVAALKAAGILTAEAAAAMEDETLTDEVPGFGVESLGRLRQWQRAKKAGVPLVPMPGRQVRPAGGERTQASREEGEPDLAERLLIEMVKSSNNPGAQLADLAWQAAERFYDRKEKLHGERGTELHVGRRLATSKASPSRPSARR